MRGETAKKRYLERHIEPHLPHIHCTTALWHHVLVIPAYRESATLLERLAGLDAASGTILVIIVLNRPDSDADEFANAELRRTLASLDSHAPDGGQVATIRISDSVEVFPLDLEALKGPTPSSEGVGLARKTGCDIAFKWISQGAVASRWIYSTDADATLPQHYFEQLTEDTNAAAAVFPFTHIDGGDDAIDSATALYELRLHHYVLGLEWAGSPYAFHTMGSCIAVRADAYAQCRGFPKRAGAEDFYLLNKLRKVGPIVHLHGNCIGLQSRKSTRVPFGTGPAVQAITDCVEPAAIPLFYHPESFAALRAVVSSATQAFGYPGRGYEKLLAQHGLQDALLDATLSALHAQGLADAHEHCCRQSKNAAQYERHFQQWFDGFRTLKLLHALRDASWPLQSLSDLVRQRPDFWPQSPVTVNALRAAMREHWQWTTPG